MFCFVLVLHKDHTVCRTSYILFDNESNYYKCLPCFMNEMKYNCILNSYLMPWEANPEPIHLQILHNAEILHVNSVC